MGELDSPSPGQQRLDQLLFASLAGVSVGAVLQLVDKEPKIENAIGVALLCFAVSIPVLASSFLMESGRSGGEKTTGRRLFDLAGVLISLTGLVLLFFHLHLMAGCAFVASAALCFVVVVRARR
jgi:hypothetical protein